MSGNCAIGRPVMAIAPTMVITMAMTMATMGLRIKNADIELAALLFCRLEGNGLYRHAFSNLQSTFGNHLFAVLQTLPDHPVRPDTFSDLHRTNGHLVV